VLKFDMLVQRAFPEAAKLLKLASGQIQDGGRRSTFKRFLKRYNSAADCSTSRKFGMYAEM